MTFKVATYNIWHGLNGDGSIRMGSLEPKGRKFLRLNYQRDILRDLGADLIFLQEVNPCPQLSADFAEYLGFDEVHQIDNAGLKILGLGFPKILLGGITILARPELKLTLVESVKLSGPRFSFSNDFISMQLYENRYALIAIVSHPKIGNLLVANFHLHHGLEITQSFLKKIEELRIAQLISQKDYDLILEVGKSAQQRRFTEITALGQALQRIQKSHNIQNTILAGDLNCSEESKEWHNLIEMGFVDTSFNKNGPNTCYTWNSEQNIENHNLGKSFHFPWFLAKRFPEKSRVTLRTALIENEFRKRRIDYIFTKGEFTISLSASSLFAYQPNRNGLVASDHFGVLSEFTI